MQYTGPTPSRIPFTKEGFAKILEERKKYQADRPDAVEHLRKAREMGDLSENGYYKAARARLSFVDAQLRRLDRLVKLGRIVETTGSDNVQIGSVVTITDGQSTFEYRIVGGYESNPAHKTISYQSPLGSSLMNKKVQDQIKISVPAGIKSYTILSIQ